MRGVGVRKDTCTRSTVIRMGSTSQMRSTSRCEGGGWTDEAGGELMRREVNGWGGGWTDFKFIKFVYIVYFFSRVFSEDVRHELYRNKAKRTDLSETRQDRRRNEVVKSKQDQREQTYSKLCEIEEKLTKFPHPYGLHKHLRPFIFIINHQNI